VPSPLTSHLLLVGALGVTSSSSSPSTPRAQCFSFAGAFAGTQRLSFAVDLSPTKKHHFTSQALWSVPPAFVVEVKVLGPPAEYKLQPSFREIEEMCLGVLEAFITAVSGAAWPFGFKPWFRRSSKHTYERPQQGTKINTLK
jgi:hypothetical protein